MNNVIELNIAEIDIVVGGAGAIQAATLQQTSTFSRPAATMVYIPNKTFNAGSMSVPSFDLSAFRASIEGLR
ncbi:MAG: hypothetical protein U1E21_23810 [Reyranellaceae bacterium]